MVINKKYKDTPICAALVRIKALFLFLPRDAGRI